ncbi:MAG: hypothetical protein ABIW38_00175, partial [Ferruginibacter sp.]
MKKIILFSLVLFFATSSYCQKIASLNYSAPQKDYLQKSKKQKTFAWVLLGSGAALVVAGVAIPKGEKDGFDILTWSDTYKNEDIKAALILSGALAMGGSIPLFIASGRNKRKALSASAF